MTVSPPQIGVAIVAYQSAPVILACLESLFRSEGASLRVVVTDNACTDQTVDLIRAWALENADRVTFQEAVLGEISVATADLTLVRSPVNGGFAYACNTGLRLLTPIEGLDLFWLVNPDCEVLPDTAAQFIRGASQGEFSLMGGRTIFRNNPDIVQTDGGRVSRLTGVCKSVNWGVPLRQAAMPSDTEIDFITGANCVASRKFIEAAGYMVEDYFIYYEEVDWAFRRGALPLRQVPEAVILHDGGTVIGSGSLNRLPSPFSTYFNSRNRIRFVRRFMPTALPLAYAFILLQSLRNVKRGALPQAKAALAGALGFKPPANVREFVAKSAWDHAFTALVDRP
ncbi:glycosyltransferase family 2 protein [Novosphingobium hassiacum]|nr:glycosyltransferase family 2 protein [Novosphingobium hassiacum]